MKTSRNVCLVSVAILVSLIPAPSVAAAPFIRGDANASLEVDIADSVRVLNFLFGGGGTRQQLGCTAAADTDGNAELEITDGVYLLNFLFLGRAAPPPPFPACGLPPAEDLPCNDYPSCTSDDCVDPAGLAARAGEAVPRVACIPNTNLQVLTFQLNVCPQPACPAEAEGGEPAFGCRVDISLVETRVESNVQILVLVLDGVVTEAPLLATDALGNETTCNATALLGGEARAPIIGEPSDSGFQIMGLEAATLDNVTLSLSAEGGPLCSLVGSAAQAFIDDVTAALQEAVNENITAIAGELIGLRVCP